MHSHERLLVCCLSNYNRKCLLFSAVTTVLFSASWRWRSVLYSFLFLRYHDNSRTAAHSSIKFCACMYFVSRKNLLNYMIIRQRRRSNFPIFYHCEIGPCRQWLLLHKADRYNGKGWCHCYKYHKMHATAATVDRFNLAQGLTVCSFNCFDVYSSHIIRQYR